MRTIPWLLAAFFGVAATALDASAREGDRVLGYQAPPECPRREQFWVELWTRSARLQRTKPDELAIAVDIRIIGGDSRYVGRLWLADAAGAVVQRELAASTCAHLSAALALVAAVSLDALPTDWQPTFSTPPRHKRTSKQVAIGPSFGIHEAVARHAVPTLGLSATYRAGQHISAPELRLEALVSLDRYQPVFTDDAGLHPSRRRSHGFARALHVRA